MNADTKSTRRVSPQYREDLADFLLRTAGLAALLSLMLMAGPLVVQSLWALDPLRLDRSAVFTLAIMPFLGIALLVALVVSAAVTLCLGAALAAVFRSLGIGAIGTRVEALRFGAAGGAVVALVEAIAILIHWSGYTGAPRELGAEYAFILQNPPPIFVNALKVAFDLVATLGIGALSGWLAWRPPRGRR